MKRQTTQKKSMVHIGCSMGFCKYRSRKRQQAKGMLKNTQVSLCTQQHRDIQEIAQTLPRQETQEVEKG